MLKCKSVPVPLSSTPASPQYRSLFNAEARKLGFPIMWLEDKAGGAASVPDPDLGEVVQDIKTHYKLTDTDVCKVLASIEGKRRPVVKTARTQMKIVPSRTLSRDILKLASPAERGWLEFVSDPLQKISMTLFGRQANYNYDELADWMTANGDPDSTHHFFRMKTPAVPTLSPASEAALRAQLDLPEGSTKSPADFANAFPWFPGAPAFNALYSADITAEDLAYFSKAYDKDSPIQLPWTVVERMAAPPPNLPRTAVTVILVRDGDLDVAWAVKGRDDKWFKVTNMVHHPRYRPLFLEAAQVLRTAAQKFPQLHPEFRDYTLTMADSFESGDLLRLLKADLNHSKGNLFLSFFPHEGYWPDGIKFPWMFEVGIRQPGAQSPAEAGLIQELEDRVAAFAKQKGLPYTRRVIDSSDAAKSAVLFWQYRSGGFMRAFVREPMGHDYPKRTYPDISQHRNVVILDATDAKVPAIQVQQKALLSNPGRSIGPTQLVDFAFWHEASHGTGERTLDTVASGRTMGDVFGPCWGAMAEPLADAGSIWLNTKRFEKGVISRAQFDQYLSAAVMFQLDRMKPRGAIMGPYLCHPEAGHLVGAAMLAGWYFKEGVLKANGPKGQLDRERIVAATNTFWERLTEFSLTDNVEGYKTFIKDAVAAIPPDVERHMLASQAKNSPWIIVNRNPNRNELQSVVK